jgi:integrase
VKNGAEISLPILPALQDEIDQAPKGNLTFLVTAYGKPFTAAGFGMRFREWCNAANLTHCTAHGLRKAGASRAAENGATDAQLNAIFGWGRAALYASRAAEGARTRGRHAAFCPKNRPRDRKRQKCPLLTGQTVRGGC